MTTIGLCMIVKNEERVIERCLDSVRPLIDYILICDTGSTDDTQAKITDWLFNNAIPGNIINDNWTDFGVNRSTALKYLRNTKDTRFWLTQEVQKSIDYALMMDADDQLVIDPGLDIAAWKASLSADMYDVLIEHGPIRHWRPHIFSNHKEFRYRGVLHEFAEGPEGHTRDQAKGIHILAGVEGHRSSDPNKYRNDAALLSRALATETDEVMRQRYAFYLAQSYKDAGDNAIALIRYMYRAEMGGWAGEVYISLYQAGQLMETLPKARGESIIGKYLSAWEADPSRAEALQAAVRYCHRTGRHHQGYLIGRHGITIPQPTNAKLFLEPWIYEWGMHDDFSVAAYWSGHYQESFDSASKALEHAPNEHRGRIADNVRFAREKLDPPFVTEIPVNIPPVKLPDQATPLISAIENQVDFTIVSVKALGYIHSGAYAELVETVMYGLRALGYTVEVSHDSDDLTFKTGKIIAIGAHLVSAQRLPANVIIYNTEHFSNIDDDYIYSGYRRMLREHRGQVLDYSQENSRRLTEILGRTVKYVPVGYAPEMTRIVPAVEQDIDVLFYGSLNERRNKILDDLRAAGLKVEYFWGVYGVERDKYVARAKIVLSMHYYTPGIFEAVRVSYLLANKKIVVCEDDERGEANEAGAYTSKYEELVDACSSIVHMDVVEREAIAEEGFETFSARYEHDILRTALRRKVWDCFLYNGEVDVLAIRLNELKDIVDRFVIVVSDTTFSGTRRQFGCSFNYPNIIGELIDRTELVLVTDMPDTPNPWEREYYQRNAITRGLADAAPDDLIMISDVDEIPRADVVREMVDNVRHEAFGLRLAFYYFLLNYRCTSGSEANKVWNCAVTKRLLDTSSPDSIRYLVHMQRCAITDGTTLHMPHIIKDAGWHFSYLGDDETVRAKIRAFSHQEYNTPEVLDAIDINRIVGEGEDLFGRPGYGWRLVGTEGLPEWVRSQPEMMERWTR